MVWSAYSDHRLLERICSIYSGALSVYTYMVERWLYALGDRLSLYSMLPACFQGFLTVQCDKSKQERDPVLTYWPRMLALGEDSAVAFELDRGGKRRGLSQDFFEERRSHFAQDRSAPAESVGFFMSRTAIGDVFDTRPATALAHRWLEKDLREINWDRF